MTDKQIIIDGVDVSGCKCFYINASHPELQECINPYCKDLCKNNPNCYYKQLKRKEQECEELKNERTIDLVKQLDQLKACLTEIKEIAHKINDECELEGFGSCALKYKEQILQKISEVENEQ